VGNWKLTAALEEYENHECAHYVVESEAKVTSPRHVTVAPGSSLIVYLTSSRPMARILSRGCSDIRGETRVTSRIPLAVGAPLVLSADTGDVTVRRLPCNCGQAICPERHSIFSWHPHGRRPRHSWVSLLRRFIPEAVQGPILTTDRLREGRGKGPKTKSLLKGMWLALHRCWEAADPASRGMVVGVHKWYDPVRKRGYSDIRAFWPKQLTTEYFWRCAREECGLLFPVPKLGDLQARRSAADFHLLLLRHVKTILPPRGWIMPLGERLARHPVTFHFQVLSRFEEVFDGDYMRALLLASAGAGKALTLDEFHEAVLERLAETGRKLQFKKLTPEVIADAVADHELLFETASQTLLATCRAHAETRGSAPTKKPWPPLDRTRPRCAAEIRLRMAKALGWSPPDDGNRGHAACDHKLPQNVVELCELSTGSRQDSTDI
jgi:hypothetical protein